MIIVWGCIEAMGNKIDDVIQLSLEHVHRSRNEPGCITHTVQVDIENKNRLIFYEEWENISALQDHFEVAESGNFIKSVALLAVKPPSIKIFKSTQIN